MISKQKHGSCFDATFLLTSSADMIALASCLVIKVVLISASVLVLVMLIADNITLMNKCGVCTQVKDANRFLGDDTNIIPRVR